MDFLKKGQEEGDCENHLSTHPCSIDSGHSQETSCKFCSVASGTAATHCLGCISPGKGCFVVKDFYMSSFSGSGPEGPDLEG